MMDRPDESFVRWRDGSAQVETLEGRAEALVQGALPPDEPAEAALARVERRLRRSRRVPLRTQLAFRLALAGAALVAGIASVKAYEWVRQASSRTPDGVLAPAHPTPRSPPSRRAAQLTIEAPAASPEVGASADEKSLAATEALAPARLPPSPPPARHGITGRVVHVEANRAPVPVAAPATDPFTPPAPAALPARALRSPSVPPATPLAAKNTDEVDALDHAMALLRRNHDAVAALAALEGYLARYPHGFLQREALSGRVDALLMLGRTEQALGALESFPFDNHRRSAELQVIRAELRARTDCTRADSDFTEALARTPDAALLERILYGRGACRAKLGDQRGAAADLERYAERFPQGQHAAWARRWLQERRPAAP